MTALDYVALHPWTTFRDALRLDDIWRRQDAMDAIKDWNQVSAELYHAACVELERCECDAQAWDRDIAAAKVAWAAMP